MTSQPESVPVADPPSTSSPLSTDGLALLDADRPYDAVPILRRAVAAGEPQGLDLLARAYLDSGSWQAAADLLGPLVDRGEVRFAGRLGVALAEIGDEEDAEAALRLAVRSGEIVAANDLAILLRDGGRLGEAVQVLVRAADGGDDHASSNLVALLLEDGDLRGAVQAAERYLDESRPDSVVALADCRAQQRDPDEAERLYRRATELDALRAHTAYGQFLYASRGDAAGAEREFREAQRHNEPAWAYTLGRFLLDEGRPAEARGFLQTAVGWGNRDAVAAIRELDGEDADDD